MRVLFFLFEGFDFGAICGPLLVSVIRVAQSFVVFVFGCFSLNFLELSSIAALDRTVRAMCLRRLQIPVARF